MPAPVERMMAPDMFSGWGVRTLSTHESRYNPLSYHLGSVWPHDNSMLISGFRRYGQNEAALSIFEALCAAAGGFRNQRMPELYCGFARGAEETHPVPYPVACSPQARAAGAIPYGLTCLLGLAADATEGVLRVLEPCLPEWLDRLRLQGLRVGETSIDLDFERDAHRKVQFHCSPVKGILRVERISELPV
jgi:glycogen debranching enzyme